MTAERDCKHGQLARSCNVCELEAEIEQLKSEMEDQYPCIERLRTAVALKNGVIKTLQDEANDARLEVERLKDGYMNGYEGGKQEARDAAHAEIDKANTLLRQALEALNKYTTPGVLGGRVPIDAELVAKIKTHLGEV